MAGRAFPRLKKRLLVEFEDASGTRHTAYTRDFSVTGLYILSEARPGPGDPQLVKVHLPRGVAELHGQIARQAGATGALAARSDGFAFALATHCDLYTDYVALMERMVPELVRTPVYAR